MTQETIRIQMDLALRNEFEEVCRELGLTMNEGMILLAKKMTRERQLPFGELGDSFCSEKNMQRLRASISQMERARPDH